MLIIQRSIRKYIITSEENLSQKFRLKNIYEIRNYLTEEINQNESMSLQSLYFILHKKVYRVWNYIEHFLILISTVTGCVLTSAFASLVGIPIEITSSVTELQVFVITAGNKKLKSIIKKRKSKLKSVEVLNSKALIDSHISQDDFVLINNVPKKFDDMKAESKNLMINKSLNYA